MRLFIKIAATIALSLTILFKLALAFAIASTAHNVQASVRESAVLEAEITLVVGIVLIILVWVLGKKTNNTLHEK